MKTANARYNSDCSVCNGSVTIGQKINYGDAQGTRHANAADCTGVVALVQVGDSTMPEDGAIRKGATVRILRGPRRGVAGLVKWIGTDDRNGGTKVGIQVDGNAKLVYTFPSNLTVVTAGAPVVAPAPMRERRAASMGTRADLFAGTALPGRATAVAVDDLRQELAGVEAQLATLLSRRDALQAQIDAAVKAERAERAAPATDAVLESYRTALANARAAGDQGAVMALNAAIADMVQAKPAPVATPEEAPAFIELTDPRVAPAPAADDSPF
jgi:hypothetical protein